MDTSHQVFRTIQNAVVTQNKQFFVDNLISVKRNPRFPELVQLKYAQGAYETMNKMQRMCRGAIFNVHTGELVANTFERFPNIGERNQYPEETAQLTGVVEKLDGTCMIVFFHNNQWMCSTLGSLMKWEKQYLLEERLKIIDKNELDPRFTYMFEVVGTENQHVTHYHFALHHILLCKVETATGKVTWAHEMDNTYFTKPHTYAYSIRQLVRLVTEDDEDYFEGWILHYSDGTVWKLKRDCYIEKFHSVMLGMTQRSFMQKVAGKVDKMKINRLLTPEEIEEILSEYDGDLHEKFRGWILDVHDYFKNHYVALGEIKKKTLGMERKESAEYITTEYPDMAPLLYSMHFGSTINLYRRWRKETQLKR